jgi:Secretion system C-terminal sorting domain
MDSDGDFVIAWHSVGQDGDGFGVYAQRYNSSGVAQGTEFLVNTYTTSYQFFPSIAMDSDGDFVIAWTSDGQNGDYWGVYAQRYNSSGVAQGTEFLVNTYTTSDQGIPSIAMDSDGDFVIAWLSDGQDGSGTGVYAQRYNSIGVAQGTEFLVNTYTTSYQGQPSIAMDSDGDFVIAWQSYGQDGNYSGVYAQRYNSSGLAQGTEFLVNTYTTSPQSSPSIAMDGDGDFVIAWTSYGQDEDGSGVYAQGYNSSGLAQGGEFLVNTYTTGYQFESSIAMDSDGDFVIAWTSDGQDGSGNGIYAQRYAAPAVSTVFVFTATKEVLLYPNPVQEVLTIENGEGTATVFNALGQPLRQFNITASKYLLDTNDLPNGIYALQVRKVDGTAVAKPFLK